LSGEGRNYSLSSAMTLQPSELSPSRSRLFHLACHTCNMYYIRIYHDISKTNDYNRIINSPSMVLPPASVQGHRVDVCLSPIDPLSMESHYFLAIFILVKQQKSRLEKEQRCKTSRNGDNSPKYPWSPERRRQPEASATRGGGDPRSRWWPR
jgi:hypothetical protein